MSPEGIARPRAQGTTMRGKAKNSTSASGTDPAKSRARKAPRRGTSGGEPAPRVVNRRAAQGVEGIAAEDPADVTEHEGPGVRVHAEDVEEVTADLAAVAHALNTRPRKRLDWRTPAEALNDHLALLQTSGVATTS